MATYQTPRRPAGRGKRSTDGARQPIPYSAIGREGWWEGPYRGAGECSSHTQVPFRQCNSFHHLVPFRGSFRQGGLPPFAYPPFFRGYGAFAPAKHFSPGTPYTPAMARRLISGPPSLGPPQNRMILWGESEQGRLPCTRLRLRSALSGGAEKKLSPKKSVIFRGPRLHFCLFRLAPDGDACPSA